MQNKTIPFVNLARLYKEHKKEILKTTDKILSSGSLILGKELESFELHFTRHVGSKYATGVSSGTSALALTLLAEGVMPGDEVIIPSFTYFATAEAVAEVKARPILADIDPKTHLMAPDHVRKLITKRTKAVIPVCMYGFPVDMKAWVEFSAKSRLPVIVDAAQAHGAKYLKKPLGSYGLTLCYSFYPSKNLGAYGDGGCICTTKKNIYEALLRLRNHGAMVKYDHVDFGFNSRLDTLQAAYLNLKLPHLDRLNKIRLLRANLYRQTLSSLPLTMPSSPPNTLPVYHLFTIHLQKRDELQAFLTQKGIQTGIHYPTPLHLLPCFRKLGYRKGDFSLAETIASHTLSLPICPFITPAEVLRVSSAVNSFFKKCS